MIDRKIVERLKEMYKKGARVKLEYMGDDPQPVPVGIRGTVDFVDDMGTIHVSWDNGSGLGVVYGEDRVSLL